MRLLPLVAAMLLVPSVASAHLALRRSDPDSNARLDRAPSAITLWFNQRPQLGFSRITLVGPAGEVSLGALSADTGNVVRAEVPGTLAAGEYTVRWQAASADGHPIRGAFRFRVAGADTSDAPAVVAPPDAPAHVHEPVPTAHASHPLYRGVRWIEFVVLVTVIGIVGFHHLVLPALAARAVPTIDAFNRARRLGQSLLVLYLPTALVRLYAESVAVHGRAEALSASGIRALLTGTTWGTGWLLGVAGAAVVLAGWRLARSGLAGSTTLAALGALAMALSPALSGHAASGTPVVASITADATHVLAASVWVGGLVIMLVAGVPAMRTTPDGKGDVAIAAMVNSFHPVALFCVPLVVISGVASAWMRLGDPALLLGSEYGRVLLIKVVLFLCAAVLGLHNSTRARRRLGSAEATRLFRVTAWSEAAIAAVVLAVTTVLIVTPLPSPPPLP